MGRQGLPESGSGHPAQPSPAAPHCTLHVPTIAFELWMVRRMYSSIASSLSAAGGGQGGTWQDVNYSSREGDATALMVSSVQNIGTAPVARRDPQWW